MGTKRISESRRNFLKKSAALAGTILATSALEPFSAIVFAASEPEDSTKPWYGIGIDIEKCEPIIILVNTELYAEYIF